MQAHIGGGVGQKSDPMLERLSSKRVLAASRQLAASECGSHPHVILVPGGIAGERSRQEDLVSVRSADLEISKVHGQRVFLLLAALQVI